MDNIKSVVLGVAIASSVTILSILNNPEIHHAELDYPDAAVVGEEIHVSVNFLGEINTIKVNSENFELVKIDSKISPGNLLRNGSKSPSQTHVDITLRCIKSNELRIIGTLDYTLE